jgi:hypothetical protein
MDSVATRKPLLVSLPIYFLCILAIAFSPLAVRWIEGGAHVRIYRDAVGQPSDLLECGAVPVAAHAAATIQDARPKPALVPRASRKF